MSNIVWIETSGQTPQNKVYTYSPLSGLSATVYYGSYGSGSEWGYSVQVRGPLPKQYVSLYVFEGDLIKAQSWCEDHLKTFMLQYQAYINKQVAVLYGG